MNKPLIGSIVIGYIIAFIFFGATVLYDLWKTYSMGCSIASTIISMIFGGLILAFILALILVIFLYKKKPIRSRKKRK